MTLAQVKRRFTPGQQVAVTNHYITREDHPCFGTRQRTITRVTSSHLHFDIGGSVPWPPASQVKAGASEVRLYGGGCGQKPDDLFLTIHCN
jgi:hypothetical protein